MASGGLSAFPAFLRLNHFGKPNIGALSNYGFLRDLSGHGKRCLEAGHTSSGYSVIILGDNLGLVFWLFLFPWASGCDWSNHRVVIIIIIIGLFSEKFFDVILV